MTATECHNLISDFFNCVFLNDDRANAKLSWSILLKIFVCFLSFAIVDADNCGWGCWKSVFIKHSNWKENKYKWWIFAEFQAVLYVQNQFLASFTIPVSTKNDESIRHRNYDWLWTQQNKNKGVGLRLTKIWWMNSKPERIIRIRALRFNFWSSINR